MKKEQMAMGYSSWVEIGLVAGDGVSWKGEISGPTFHLEERNDNNRLIIDFYSFVRINFLPVVSVCVLLLA